MQENLHSSLLIREGERLDDLMLNGLKIIQRPGTFRFGTDAVLLADFASPKRNDKVADLGTGTGILPILMAGHQHGAVFDAVEIQAEMADMALRSTLWNGLDQRIKVHNMDMRDAPKALGCGKYSLVTCNPPYSPEGTALPSESDTKRVSRHEGLCTIDDVSKCAASLLKNGGRVALVYPAPRALGLMTSLRKFGLEPKRIRIIQDRPGAVPKLVLLDAVKGGGEMLHWLPPLVLKHPDGSYTREWLRIYGLDET